MHTAICAFDERERAQQAVDSLIRAGFNGGDIHIEHKTVSIEGDPLVDRKADDAQQPVRDRGALSSFGAFFASLLGGDNPSGHGDTYSQHVERGSYVVVVDGKDASEAQRARTLLQDMQGGDVNVLDRAEQRPLRDIVSGRAGTAGMVDRSRDVYESTSGEVPDRERAMASNRVDASPGPALRDPDVTHAPGLRYLDKDKPNG
jgi:hypothetical protein